MSLDAVDILTQPCWGAPGYSERSARRTAWRCACGALGWWLCDRCGRALCGDCRESADGGMDPCSTRHRGIVDRIPEPELVEALGVVDDQGDLLQLEAFELGEP